MLNQDKDNIGKLFHEVLDDFDENLPNRVWDNVSHELNKDKKRKRTLIYLSIAASVALIIAYSSGYFMALNNSKKHQQFSDTKTNKELKTSQLVNQEDTKTNLKKDDTTKINTVLNNISKILKINNLPPLIPQTTISLDLQQNKNDQHKDSSNVSADSISNNTQIFLAKNNTNSLINDTVNTKKTVINLYKDFNKEPDNQADIINKNQNTIKNNLPIENKKEQEKSSGKWSLAEQFSPVGYFGNNQKSDFADATAYSYGANNQQGNEPVNNKKLLIVYATGMSFKYQMGPKWGIKSGIYYATGELNTGQQHKQIEVPVMADYALINKKFKWEINGGFVANFLFSTGEKSTNYSGLLGTTLGYNISSRISVNIEPTLKYNFSYPYNYIFHYYPYSFAVYSGLSYNF